MSKKMFISREVDGTLEYENLYRCKKTTKLLQRHYTLQYLNATEHGPGISISIIRPETEIMRL